MFDDTGWFPDNPKQNPDPAPGPLPFWTWPMFFVLLSLIVLERVVKNATGS